MKIVSLSLQNFRNHEQLTLDFPNGVTTIIGRNGLGKTNIVEAINFAATLSSHRVSSDELLIQHEKESAQILVKANKHNRQATIALTLNRDASNSALLNGTKPKRPRDIVGVLQVVIFSPEDLDLIKGDPAVRRKFIDTFMMLYSPLVADVKHQYERALKQRNSLLKSAGRRALSETALQTLEVWDEQIVQFGSHLVSARLRGINILKPFVQNFGDVISGNQENVDITYSSSWLQESSTSESAIAQDLQAALVSRRNEEIDRGITLSGPHRDDVAVTMNNKLVKGYASHGQTWSAAIALRLATFQALREHDGDPILILDDVFAELDQHRRTRLASVITDVEQTIITVANPEDLPQSLTGENVWLEERVHHA